MAKRSSKSKTMNIRLIKSPIGYSMRQKRTVRALGLYKVQQIVEHPDTAAIRGMVEKLPHLLEVVDG